MAMLTTSRSDGGLCKLARKKLSQPAVQCMARAVYDNIAEAPDELAFRKGDVLTVLEQNTGDLEGWWLCSLRGRQGICPGNRLRLMVGVYNTPAQSPTSPASASRAKSPNFSVSMTALPQKPGDGYMYDTPKGTSIMNLTQGMYDTPKGRSVLMEEYDTPKPTQSPVFAMYDVPKSHGTLRRPSPEPSNYDTPKCCVEPVDVPDGLTVPVSLYDVPPSSNRSSGASEMSLCSSSSSAGATHLTSSLSLSSLGSGARSNRSSAELYDVPQPSNNNGSRIAAAAVYSTPPAAVPLPLPAKGFGTGCLPGSGDGLYDVPPQVTRDAGGGSLRLSACPCPTVDAPASPALKDPPRELPLQLDAAMDTLVKLQQEVQADCNKLLSRKSDQLEYRTLHVKDVCHQIRTKLVDFVQFASGASGNAFKLADHAVYNRLNRYVRPLHEANAKVQALCKSLDDHEWSSDYLSRNDELDQLVDVARGLVEDVRQTASFIQGNSTLIFKRCAQPQRPLPSIPTPPAPATKPAPSPVKEKGLDSENTYENDGKSWLDDYEYVNLEPKEKIEREEEATKASMPADLQKSFENLLKESRVQVADPICKVTQDEPTIDPTDRQVLNFYRIQMDKHFEILSNAIAAFLHTIRDNRPPAVFVAHSKFVIISSHKLMFIGDTVHRNVGHQAARDRVRLKADALCQALQAAVSATKTAAIEFPAYTAVQDMVESVMAISQVANDLRSAVKC